MNVIESNEQFHIYHDSVATHNKLPNQTYIVCWHKMQGFWLEPYTDFTISEKVYGVHENKVTKVLTSFKKFNRSLGVMLSGDKGIGKSLFVKMTSIRAIEEGYPVIIVDTAYPGIASFIDSIDQEVVILFDEFDKTFRKTSDSNPQADLLSLFDGFSGGKKLYMITCNDLRDINDYLLNRPGRFHYHFRFEYPTAEEIRIYLKDHIDSKYYNEINSVIEFAAKTKLNFDCLRAIAFELDNGETFADAIRDLNIINTHTCKSYTAIYIFNNGQRMVDDDVELDLLNIDSDDFIQTMRIYYSGCYIGTVEYRDSNIQFDLTTMQHYLSSDHFEKISYNDEDSMSEYLSDVELKKAMDCIKSGLKKIAFKLNDSKSIHFNFK